MFITRQKLPDLLYASLVALGGEATIIEVCRHFWEHYEEVLRNSGDLFYTWQYDIRWAATELRKNGTMLSAEDSPKGLWKLS